MRTAKDFRQEQKDVYKAFKKAHPEHKKTTYDTFRAIIQEFNMLMRDYVLETGDELALPVGHGRIKIQKRKQRTKIKVKGENGEIVEKCGLKIDYAATKKYGKVIYHMNEHTDGYIFSIKWESYSSRVPFRTLINFKPYRVFSRLVTHYVSQREYRDKYDLSRRIPR